MFILPLGGLFNSIGARNATREEAKETELKIKKWSRRKKEALAKEDWNAFHESAKKKEWEGIQRKELSES